MAGVKGMRWGVRKGYIKHPRKKKNKIPKINKITNKEKLINILENARNTLKERIKFNSEVKVTVKGRTYDYSNLSNDAWVADDIKKINKYINDLKNKDIRPRQKTVELYQELYGFKNKLSDVGAYTNTRDANFNHLILTKLEESGIDPTNPSAIANLFKNHSVKDIYVAWVLNGGDTDNFYEELEEDPQGFIKDIVMNYDEIIETAKRNNDELFEKILDEML